MKELSLVYKPPRLLLGFLMLCALQGLDANAQTPETFVPTGNMTTPRLGHTATLLKDGRVLIAGGFPYENPNRDPLASAELYDPSTGNFALTGSMTSGRVGQAAALLPDGRVLVAGGNNQRDLGTAELYDPVTGTFMPTGNMVSAQSRHTATLLNNGKVLITGVGAELYDPSTGSFSPVDMVLEGSPSAPSSREMLGTKAAPLFDGKILIKGGYSPAKLYDPTTNVVESLGLPARRPFLRGHTATLLPTGNVLIAGGIDLAADYFAPPLARAELYDPGSRTFQVTQSLLIRRAGHTATPLLGGLVLIAGGEGYDENENYFQVSTGELFDPYTETFRLTGSMASFHDTATLLGNGTVLMTGGNTTAAELYLPPLLTLDGTRVRPGDSFTATFSGTNLNNETYYDLRFHAPGDTTEYVALNWQRGPTATHSVGTGMATGTWTVTGVRSHQNINDHAADFVSVSVELLVTR
jgi:Galactose oxidase, central domain